MANAVATDTMIQKFRLHDTDTGSPQVQVVRLADRINQLSSHFQSHKKDFTSRHGLLRMVSRRRRLLEYLKRYDEGAYRTILRSTSCHRISNPTRKISRPATGS